MLPSAGARRPRQDKTAPPGLLARTAPGSLQPAKAAGWGHLFPPPLSFLGRDSKAGHAELPGAAGSLASCQAALVGNPCPGLGLDPSCLGQQQRQRLGYFKQVMSVLPSLSLPFSPKH